MRLLFVTPRYGELAGGAENLCRALIDRCCAGYEVEVATTCATELFTCANELPEGPAEVDGRLVRRFLVSRAHAPGAPADRTDYADDVLSLARSIWSRDLHRFLVAEGESYDLILLAPYLFGTTFWGAQVHPDRSVLIPCLHDEPDAHLAPMRDLFASVRGCIFNTSAEERLARRLYPVRRSGVVGIGIDAPAGHTEGAKFRAEHSPERPYLVYCGRLEEGKGVHVLAEHVLRYNRSRAASREPVDLLLAGQGPYRPPDSEHVRALGFLPEREKRAALAGAMAFCTASEMESLSIVALEAWREGTPVIAATGSDVMVEHLEASGGGMGFGEYRDFARAVDAYREPERRRQAGESGRRYVTRRYGWEAVRERFRRTVEELAA